MSCSRGFTALRAALQRGVHRLLEVGDDVIGVFESAAQTHQVDAHAGFLKLRFRQLAVCGASGIQDARTGIRHMRGNGHQLKVVKERRDLVTTAGHAESDDAAGAVRHVFLRSLIILVAFQTWMIHPRDARIGGEELRHLIAVLHMLAHAQSQILEVLPQNPRIHRRRNGAEVAHELCHALRDERAALAELLGVHNTVIGIIRRGQSWELVGMRHPVEVA